MNFNQLVFRNVIRNGREYLTYFFSSLFSVMVFFIFSLLYFHPQLGDQLRGSSDGMSEMANFGITVAEVVIAIMSFVFLWYAFNTFLKGRKKQLSVYLTIGMSQKKLKKMILYENLLLGFSSIVLGTLASLIFSKFILLVSQNILALDEGLPFYFPYQAIGLTSLVYGVIFILISIFTIFDLRKLDFNQMKFSNDDIVAEPRTSTLLTTLGVVFILVGYSLAFLFSLSVSGYLPVGANLLVLLACVLITILGTFLFFKYASVKVFRSLKNKKIFFKDGNMLTISNLMQRMKANAMMYFLISIVGAIAFVGIGVSKAIAGREFGSTQGDSFAIVYQQNYGEQTKENQKLHKERVNAIEEMVKEKGHKYLSTEINPTEVWLEPEEGEPNVNYLNVISETKANELLSFMGKETVHLDDDDTLLRLASTNGDVNGIKAKKLDQQIFDQNMIYYLDEREEILPIKITYSTTQLSLESRRNLTVATDKKYQELLEKNEYQYNDLQIIHFNDWQEDKELNKEVVNYLQQINDDSSKKFDDYFSSINKMPSDDLTDEEIEGMLKIENGSVYYSTMYQTWTNTKQKNGTILLISVLLGSVFFTFSCSIIYFKLFGELEKDGKYHRSLHILGVPEKKRKKMVTTEMLIMFFIPFVISALHFIAAMSALRIMIELPVYMYVLQILSIYIFFQLIFFFICRRQYLNTLNKYAENIKR
ncbi:ABC transporter permease [Vagococcus fluvialis]|uniref:ABC transporter permease n=1 Tax=Vagococcus fluvialis TaxID=2738 RepID=UPI001432822F|nr:ABC transporter permease [Vagococcus fluvialis]NKC60745.1 ABC transporter permease [Vagococcus fluvialis]NKD51593.1 ABC transporter permease [Vagococcus fluvialis]